jgi:hypothetical protein
VWLLAAKTEEMEQREKEYGGGGDEVVEVGVGRPYTCVEATRPRRGDEAVDPPSPNLDRRRRQLDAGATTAEPQRRPRACSPCSRCCRVQSLLSLGVLFRAHPPPAAVGKRREGAAMADRPIGGGRGGEEAADWGLVLFPRSRFSSGTKGRARK